MFRLIGFASILFALPVWGDDIQLIEPSSLLPPTTLELPSLPITPIVPSEARSAVVFPQPVYALEPVTPRTHPVESAPIRWSWFPESRSRFLFDVGGVAIFASLSGKRVPSSAFTSIAPWRFPDFADPQPRISAGGMGLIGWEFAELPLSLFSRVQSYGTTRQLDSHIMDPNFAAFSQTPVMQRLRNQTGELSGWPINQSAGLDREFYRTSILNGLPYPYASVVQKSRLAATTLDFVSELRVLSDSGVRFNLLGGLRYGNFFYEDIAQGRGIDQRANTSFNGWGPIIGTRIDVSFIGFRFDIGYLSGESRQIYSETMTAPNPFRFAYARETKNIQVPVTRLEVELPIPFFPILPIASSISYQYERWWNVGNVGGSNFSLNSHGVVAKVGWMY